MDEQLKDNNETPDRPKGKWFGRGIYGSKDVPIRILDGLIAGMIVLTLILIVFFTINGGFEVSFDTQGGSEVAALEVRYGELVPEPEVPYKPGFTFEGWYVEIAGEEKRWDFFADKAEGDLHMYAKWTPAEITVKFDLDGGVFEEAETESTSKQVVYGEPYGELPTPTKEGNTFAGWEYSGSIITPDTIVQMTGEHVLTAVWE